MKDLEKILDILERKYEKAGVQAADLAEGILGNKWYMAADSKERISFALRADGPMEPEKYQSLVKPLMGLPLNVCAKKLLAQGEGRGILVSILNLMSKPFNTTEALLRQGIVKTEGLHFPVDVAKKKVGLIGYGVYLDFFLGKCPQFHAFDLRREEDIFSTRVMTEETKTYPEGVIFHLGKNALEFSDILEELDIVIMSGSTIVNNSYEKLLKVSKKAQLVGLYGPSSELCPEYFFDLGFQYIFSTSVRDKKAYLNAALSASPFFREFEFMDLYELKRE